MGFVKSPDPRLDVLWAPMAAMLGQLSLVGKRPISVEDHVLREQDSGLYINIDGGKLGWCREVEFATLMSRCDAKELAQYFMFRAHQIGIESIVHYDEVDCGLTTPDYLPDDLDE